MLGVTTNPVMTAADKVIKEVAEDMGAGDTFRLTPVGVYFGARARPRAPRSPTRSSAAPDHNGAPASAAGRA